MLFQILLRPVIRKGSLRLVTAGGKTYDFGNGAAPRCVVKLHHKNLEWSLALRPRLKIGEAYMDGLLTVEDGSLRDFLEILAMNDRHLEESGLFKWISRLFRQSHKLKQFNPAGRARRNVAFHYDLSTKLYDLFLDSDRQYSCGYFLDPEATLEQAQFDKKRHIASKLYLSEPGLTVLDIGSGWGGMGLYLAKEGNCDVTGVTLSVEQYRISQNRARAAGLDKQCRFELRDYRQEEGPYDRIVSVGMFEHVGKKNYDEFFAKIHQILAEDGVCVLHAIGRFNEPCPINPFIRKHIFPGADVAALSEVMQSIERSGLYIADVEILRLHYARTLQHWTKRFQARRAEAAAIYDETFCRKWEFYLIGCEMGFRYQQLMVFQIQLTKRLETLPITRDYMQAWEREHSARAPYRQGGKISA